MHTRLIAALLALFGLLAAAPPAAAQDELPAGIQRVYDDYRDDGVIEACEHPRRALRRTLERLEPEANLDTPDLRPALEAGIEQHKSGDCAEAEATPTPTPSPTATPAPTSTPAPVPTADPDDPVDSGELPALPPLDEGDGGGAGGSTPPTADDVTPLDPEVAPVPPPAETLIPPATPPPAPVAVYDNPDDDVPAALLVLAGLIALLALLALLYAVVSRLGWADAKLAGPRRAWREAAFRAGGTWGDFADWIRIGR